MTTIRLVSAAFIAIAMISTPAAAHENSKAGRQIVLKGSANAYSTTDRWIYSDTQPDGVCDHGDNPAIC